MRMQEKMAELKAAQAIFATFTQAQVDSVFKAVALAANVNRVDLAFAAVADTGMGVAEDKTTKNHFAAEFVFNK